MKGKSAKKGKSKKKAASWEFEGGSATLENESDEEQQQPKRIRTQEKDEKLRRSRMKMYDAKLKREKSAILSQKVRFRDVIIQSTDPSAAASEGEMEESDTPNANIELSEERSQKKRPRSSLTAIDRLQLVLSKSRGDASKKSSQTQLKTRKTLFPHNENAQPADKPTNSLVSESKDAFVNDVQLTFQPYGSAATMLPDADIDENLSTGGNGGDENENHVELQSSEAVDPFQHYFNQPHTNLPQPSSKLTLWKKLTFAGHEYSLLVNKEQKTSVDTFHSSFHRIQELPGLNKLWRNVLTPLPLTNSFVRNTLGSLSLYQDVFVEGRDHHNDKVLLETMLMHSLFHVVKARSRVIKHNQKLKSRRRDNILSSLQDETDHDEEQPLLSVKSNKRKRKATTEPTSTTLAMKPLTEEEENAYRDQGFVRPRLLILVPFRHMARTVIEMMITILGENTSVVGLEKLYTEYGDPVPETENPLFLNTNNKKKDKKAPERKPVDWENHFLNKNVDDDFRMGIQVNPNQGKGNTSGQSSTKGVYLRLYSDFYISDIILASPIGLKLAMETNKSKNGQTNLDFDFLSSIELVLIHQADVLAMQNWEHVDYLFRHMNLMPRVSHDDTDYSRIRSYFLDGQAAKYRQIMLTTEGNTPEIQALFREFALSHSGSLKWRRNWSEGVIADVFVPVKQVFQILPRSITSFAESEERRWMTFQEQILAPMLRLQQKRVLIIAPSYLQFVRIRNYLLEQEVNVALLSEYSSESDISRSRVMFYQGLKDILLYSGRSHFFRRFRIRGARHIVFYSLPDQAHFYPELVNMLSSVFEDIKPKHLAEEDEAGSGDLVNNEEFATEMTCVSLCSHYDQMALERILGREKSEQMLLSEKSTFVFF